MPSEHKSPKLVTPKPLDRQSIEEKALRYLDRFDASASRLRRVLGQFVRQRAKETGVEVAPYAAMVEETVTRYQSSGLVDDRRYGLAIARTLAERGASRQAIRAKLFARGVGANVIDDVIAGLGREAGSELDSARALVRKRRLGNYRPPNERRDNYRRDLGILARAGFDFDTARTALGTEGEDENAETF